MDINKFKEANKINIPKKDLELLYYQAKARDIKNKDLKDIKKSLYEIVPLGQYSPDTFMHLIKILKTLPDTALKRIEQGEFIKIYNIIAQKKRYYKGDFTNCNDLLLLLYTDYNNINSNQEFNRISDSFWQLNTLGYQEDIFNLVFNINPHLAYVLEDAKRYFEYGPQRVINPFNTIINKLNNLFNNIQVALLMNIDTFNYQYQLPTDILLFLSENLEITEKTILKYYTESQDKYQFAKTLLTEYLNLKNNHNLTSPSIEEFNQKTKRLLKEEN